jgi:hypothetical protein
VGPGLLSDPERIVQEDQGLPHLLVKLVELGPKSGSAADRIVPRTRLTGTAPYSA